MSLILTVFIGLRVTGGNANGTNVTVGHNEKDVAGKGRGSTRTEGGARAPDSSGKFARERGEQRSVAIGGPAFQLYHDTGMLNPTILELAGVPVEKRAELQQKIEHRWAEFSHEFESRAELIEAGDGGESLGTYRIAGSASIADAFKKSLEEEISPYTGRGGAKILLKHLDRESHFAGLGRYNLEMKLFKTDSMGEMVRAVNYEVTDPKSGRSLASGSTSDPLAYWMRFGNAFSGEE